MTIGPKWFFIRYQRIKKERQTEPCLKKKRKVKEWQMWSL